MRFALMLLAFAAGGAIYSFICMKCKAKNLLIYYIPSILTGAVSLYYGIRVSLNDYDGLEGLGFVILIMMFLSMLAGNVLANIVITVLRKKRKKELEKG